MRVACLAAGKASNHIQLWGPALTTACTDTLIGAGSDRAFSMLLADAARKA